MHWVIYLFWGMVAITSGAFVIYLIFSLGVNTTLRFSKARGDKSQATVPLAKQPGSQEPEPSPSPAVGATLSPDELKARVLRREYQLFNIGGDVALLDQRRFDHGEEFTDEEIAVLFEPVDDRKALVNVALAGDVSIEQVKLITVAKNEFAVEMDLRNNTNRAISVNIPKGQVFEKKEPGNKQNLAAANKRTITIPAPTRHGPRTRRFSVPALCINKHFDNPDSLGNITIFALKDKSWINQHQLSNLIERLRDEAEGPELSVED